MPAMVSVESSAEVLANIKTEDGTLVVEYLGDGVGLTKFSGHFTKPFAEYVITYVSRLSLRHGSLHMFHDWWDLQRHDADARSRLSRWALETRKDRASVHILVQVSSPILAMAVTVTNMMLRDVVQVHENRAAFDRELARCRQAGRGR